jgi:predicted transcriptional regulator
MEWYIRFKNTESSKWLKARNYQIRYVENYIKFGIHPSTEFVTFNSIHKNPETHTIYTTYLNEYGETVEMLFDLPDHIAYINRIIDF